MLFFLSFLSGLLLSTFWRYKWCIITLIGWKIYEDGHDICELLVDLHSPSPESMYGAEQSWGPVQCGNLMGGTYGEVLCMEIDSTMFVPHRAKPKFYLCNWKQCSLIPRSYPFCSLNLSSLCLKSTSPLIFSQWNVGST